MGLRFISQLLLMTLLLQITAKHAHSRTHSTPEPDSSVHYGEFCLRVSDYPHWTSPEPVTQQPTKPTSPTKQPRQPNRGSTEPLKETDAPAPSSQSPTQQTPAYPKTAQNPPVVDEMMAPSELTSDKCECKKIDEKLVSDVSQITSMIMRSPNQTCRRKQFLASTKDGTEVCVPKSIAKQYTKNVLGKAKTGRPGVSPTPRDTNRQQQTTTEPTVAKTTQAHDLNPQPTNSHPSDNTKEAEYEADYRLEGLACMSCTSDGLGPDLQDIDYVYLMEQSEDCPHLLHIQDKSERKLCVDSSHSMFMTLLDQLDI